MTRGFEDPSDYLVRQRGKPALGVGVVMAKGANILDFGKAVAAATGRVHGRGAARASTSSRSPISPHVVEHAIVEFERSFLEALAIVPRRQLPVARMAHRDRGRAVGAARAGDHLRWRWRMLGIDLHRITLGALIIALGLLVDDAIIAVEMMVVKMEQGWDRVRAAAFAWTSTAFPMLTGTLVTAAGFLPVGFANSAVGEYAGGIFWVVAIALVASWFVAVIFTPYLGVKLLPARPLAQHAQADPHAIYETRSLSARSAASWRSACAGAALTVLATIVIFAASVVAFGRVQQQFFPLVRAAGAVLPAAPAGGHGHRRDDRDARGRPRGCSRDDPDIVTHTTYIGQGSPRFWLGLNPQLPNEAFAEIVIVAKDVEARERIKARLEKAVDARAPWRRRACGSTASTSARRSASRCSSG